MLGIVDLQDSGSKSSTQLNAEKRTQAQSTSMSVSTIKTLSEVSTLWCHTWMISCWFWRDLLSNRT